MHKLKPYLLLICKILQLDKQCFCYYNNYYGMGRNKKQKKFKTTIDALVKSRKLNLSPQHIGAQLVLHHCMLCLEIRRKTFYEAITIGYFVLVNLYLRVINPFV